MDSTLMKKLLSILFFLPLFAVAQQSYVMKVETIRYKIFTEANRQLADTIKKK